MIRLLMFLLLVALILTGGSAVVYRGWQVTHASQPAAKIAKAKPAEIVASLIAWGTSAPETAIPALTRDVVKQAPWLPETTLQDVRVATAGVFKTFTDNETVASATTWATDKLAGAASSLGLSPSAQVAQAPAPQPAVARPAPQPVAPPPPPAPIVSAPPQAPAPTKTVTAAPVTVAPPPAAPAAPVVVAKVAPSRPAPIEVAPAETEVSNASPWTVTEKGCAVGGIAGTGASLVIGPAEIAAWATGAAAVLPATARLVGTVIGAALLTGCATGALVAPAIAK